MAAWILPLISTVGGFISDGVKGFFGIKQANAENLGKAIEVINSSNMSAAERETAIAAVIQAETTNGYWLSAVWRPLFMLILCVIVICYCLGWTTPNLLKPMPEASMMAQLFELLKIGVMGYMPLRTVDKIVEAIARSNTTKVIIETLAKTKIKSNEE